LFSLVYPIKKPPARRFWRLPSPKLIIILENANYIAMLKEKLLEIKQFYRNLKLAPMAERD